MQGRLTDGRLPGHETPVQRSGEAPLRGRLWALGAILVLGLVYPMGTGCRAQREPAAQDNLNQALPAPPSPVRLLRPGAPGSFVSMVAAIRPSLVNLHAPSPVSGGPASLLPDLRSEDAPLYAVSPMRETVERSLGSGVIINRQGHVVTGLHVIRNAAEVLARLHDGTVLGTSLVGRDDDTGVVVLKLVPPSGRPLPHLSPAPLGDSSLLRPGDWVVAAGDPFGTTPYLSAGLVSSPGVSQGVTLSRPGYFSFISSDARVNAGNAGGPLLSPSGEVVGINVLFDDRDRPLGFAVPVNVIRDVLPTLLKHGQVDRSWLGVYVKKVTQNEATSSGLGAPRGALVTEVVEGGPAALAGLRPGDVVLEFDGKAIARHLDLSFAAARTPSEKTVVIKLWRSNREHAISVRLERKPQ